MDEVLNLLDKITPLWAVFFSSFLVVVIYVYRTARTIKLEKKSTLHALAENSAIIIIHGVFAFLYGSFWWADTAIEARGPIVRFALIVLFTLQASRGLYHIAFYSK